MQLSDLVAREAVRDLVARYNGYGDAGRFDDAAALFTEHAQLVLDAASYSGRDEIRAMFSAAAGPAPERVQHVTSTLVIDVIEPGFVKARCYFQVLTERGLDHWGRYRDEIVDLDGRWLFARREVRVDGMTPGGWAATRLDRGAADP